MHIAAANPQYLQRADVPEGELEREKDILRKQALESGKPEKVVDKIVSGRIEKYYSENCLMEQHFVKDPDLTIEDYRKATVAKIGENISIRRFVRYQLGEGLEKRSDDFAAEVASQVGDKAN